MLVPVCLVPTVVYHLSNPFPLLLLPFGSVCSFTADLFIFCVILYVFAQDGCCGTKLGLVCWSMRTGSCHSIGVKWIKTMSICQILKLWYIADFIFIFVNLLCIHLWFNVIISDYVSNILIPTLMSIVVQSEACPPLQGILTNQGTIY